MTSGVEHKKSRTPRSKTPIAAPAANNSSKTQVAVIPAGDQKFLTNCKFKLQRFLEKNQWELGNFIGTGVSGSVQALCYRRNKGTCASVMKTVVLDVTNKRGIEEARDELKLHAYVFKKDPRVVTALMHSWECDDSEVDAADGKVLTKAKKISINSVYQRMDETLYDYLRRSGGVLRMEDFVQLCQMATQLTKMYVQHGDLHGSNIMYNKLTRQFRFIDLGRAWRWDQVRSMGDFAKSNATGANQAVFVCDTFAEKGRVLATIMDDATDDDFETIYDQRSSFNLFSLYQILVVNYGVDIKNGSEPKRPLTLQDFPRGQLSPEFIQAVANTCENWMTKEYVESDISTTGSSSSASSGSGDELKNKKPKDSETKYAGSNKPKKAAFRVKTPRPKAVADTKEEEEDDEDEGKGESTTPIDPKNLKHNKTPKTIRRDQSGSTKTPKTIRRSTRTSPKKSP